MARYVTIHAVAKSGVPDRLLPSTAPCIVTYTRGQRHGLQAALLINTSETNLTRNLQQHVLAVNS